MKKLILLLLFIIFPILSYAEKKYTPPRANKKSSLSRPSKTHSAPPRRPHQKPGRPSHIARPIVRPPAIIGRPTVIIPPRRPYYHHYRPWVYSTLPPYYYGTTTVIQTAPPLEYVDYNQYLAEININKGMQKSLSLYTQTLKDYQQILIQLSKEVEKTPLYVFNTLQQNQELYEKLAAWNQSIIGVLTGPFTSPTPDLNAPFYKDHYSPPVATLLKTMNLNEDLLKGFTQSPEINNPEAEVYYNLQIQELLQAKNLLQLLEQLRW